MPFHESFDAVVSFTAIHWMSNKKGVIAGASRALKSGGMLTFTIPLGPPQTLLLAAKEVSENERWKKYFHNFTPRWNFPVPDQFIIVVNEENFQLLSSDIVEQFDNFPSKEYFKNYVIQWFPYLDPLPKELKEPFLEQVIVRYMELENLVSVVKFRFKTLEVIAKKN